MYNNRGRDGIIMEAVIKYCNSAEQKLSLTKEGRGTDSTYPRYTECAVRRLLKIFSVEETNLSEDLAELNVEAALGSTNLTMRWRRPLLKTV